MCILKEQARIIFFNCSSFDYSIYLYIVALIDSLHYARTCSTYLSFDQKLFDAICIIFNA
jgi:hypothetical protein